MLILVNIIVLKYDFKRSRHVLHSLKTNIIASIETIETDY